MLGDLPDSLVLQVSLWLACVTAYVVCYTAYFLYTAYNWLVIRLRKRRYAYDEPYAIDWSRKKKLENLICSRQAHILVKLDIWPKDQRWKIGYWRTL